MRGPEPAGAHTSGLSPHCCVFWLPPVAPANPVADAPSSYCDDPVAELAHCPNVYPFFFPESPPHALEEHTPAPESASLVTDGSGGSAGGASMSRSGKS